MNKTIILSLVAMLVLSIGCGKSNTSAPAEDSLNFEVTNNDTPENFDAAMAEMSSAGIEVPDPVTDEQLTEVSIQDLDADLSVVDQASIEEDHRPNFRRILHHLHRRFRGLRPCLEENDDPSLRRVAYGAFLAMRHGIRALETGHPRVALHFFHRANRLLNLAYQICRAEDEGGGRG